MAFLGIKIPHECGRLLNSIEVPGTQVAVSDLHITLLYFGEDWPISEITKALEATYKVISHTNPFMVETKSITSFPLGDEGAAVVIRADSKELHAMRKRLAKEFAKQNIEFDKTYKTYKPHITLSYAESIITDTALETPIEFSVQEVVLWGGDHGDDRIFLTFPLKGPETQKSAVCLQKTAILNKIANNPKQDNFTQSYERRSKER